jgi:predicted glycosyltransferase
MTETEPLRLALFTHDAFGLGHVRRSTRILRAVAERAPDASLLLIAGSPATHLLRRLPEGADYLKIPTITTSGGRATKPPTLGVPTSDLVALRGAITRRALEAFEPDVFLVDNFPLGTRRELLPVLEALRSSATRTVLGLRDVVDPPEKVRRDWARHDVQAHVESLYDRVIVYGVREVLDAVEAYALSPAIASRLEYAGYVTEETADLRPRDAVLADLGLDATPLLATVGGGADGRPILEAFAGALARFPDRPALLVTGELMGEEDRAAVRAAVAAAPRARVVDHVEDLPSLLAASELVVAMGGYNTSAEILGVGARAVLVPRTWRSGEHGEKGKTGVDAEQRVRAEGLARLGAVGLVDADEVDALSLGDAMERALARPRPERRPALALDGAARVADILLRIARR